MAGNTYTAYAYLTYLLLSIGITIWVARTLRRNGLIFLIGSDAERPFAEAFSNLLIVGFDLINFGVISFLMKTADRVSDLQTGIELLSTKMGMILLILGAMHFTLLTIFAATKKSIEEQRVLNHLGT